MTEDKKVKTFRGVKAFKLSKDGRLQTGGFAGSIETFFEEGKTYSVSNEKEIKLCFHGFHFYKEENACFSANLFWEKTVLHEITAYGNVISDNEKCVAKTIKIGKKIILKLDENSNSGGYNSGNSNSGNRNSGHCNSGDYNSGGYNSGDHNSGSSNSGNFNTGYFNSGNENSGSSNSGGHNSGDFNSGYYNSGNWNSGDLNNGCFNTEEPEFINIFNKPCELKTWEKANKPGLLFFSTRDNETYKEAFQRSWENTTEEDRKLVEELPNFNWEIFTEISGITKPIEKKKMERRITIRIKDFLRQYKENQNLKKAAKRAIRRNR